MYYLKTLHHRNYVKYFPRALLLEQRPWKFFCETFLECLWGERLWKVSVVLLFWHFTGWNIFWWRRELVQRRIVGIQTLWSRWLSNGAAAPSFWLRPQDGHMRNPLGVDMWHSSRRVPHNLTKTGASQSPCRPQGLFMCSLSMLSVASSPLTIAGERARTHSHTRSVYSSSQWEWDGEERLPAGLQLQHHPPPSARCEQR